jgi:hypothetical protein
MHSASIVRWHTMKPNRIGVDLVSCGACSLIGGPTRHLTFALLSEPHLTVGTIGVARLLSVEAVMLFHLFPYSYGITTSSRGLCIGLEMRYIDLLNS